MRLLIWPWEIIAAALVMYWLREVAPQRGLQQLAPIRCSGDPREIYLA
jgi:hypothetical protein